MNRWTVIWAPIFWLYALTSVYAVQEGGGPGSKTAPPSPRVEVLAPSGELVFGEPHELFAKLDFPGTLAVAAVPATLAGFAFVDETRQEDGDRVIITRRYRGVVLDVEKMVVPPVEVSWRSGDGTVVTATSPAVEFTVEPGSAPTDFLEAENLDALVDIPFSWRRSLALLIAVVLLSISLVAGSIWKKEPPAKPAATPAEDARRSLLDLQGGEGLDAEALRRIHAAISWTLRDFIGRVSGFSALEMTTEELAIHVGANDRLPKSDHVALMAILGRCDAAKYAGISCDVAATKALLQEALEFVTRHPAPASAFAEGDDPAEVAP